MGGGWSSNQEELTEKEKRLKKIEKENEDWKKKYNKLKEENDDLKEKYNELKDENDDLKEKMKDSEKNRVPLEKPWNGVEIDFSIETKEELFGKIDEIMGNLLNCQSINIMMIGTLASGKSSFANTLKTVMRDRGQIANPAAVYGQHHQSVTRKLQEVILKESQNGKKLRIFDCRGIPLDEAKSKKIFQADLIKTIEGYIMKDYEFQESKEIDEDHKQFRKNPTISDKMHCVLFVMKATNIKTAAQNETMQWIKEYLASKHIPFRLILTAVDELDLCETSSLGGVYHSRDVKLKVEEAKHYFDVQDNQILPVANYVSGTIQDVYRDVLALQATVNISQESLSFIEVNE